MNDRQPKERFTRRGGIRVRSVSSRSLRAAGGAAVALGVVAVTVLAQPALSAGAAVPTASAATAAKATRGWIRFGHFASGQGPVKVRIDGRMVTSKARFETVTPYQSVPDGMNTVTVTAAADPSVRLTSHVVVTHGAAITVAALRTGAGNGLVLHQYHDNLAAAPAGEAKVRIIDTNPSDPSLSVHLVPNVAPATVATKGESTGVAKRTPRFIDGVAFGQASPYVDISAGTYQVTVRNGQGTQLIKGTDWPVVAGTVASVVVVRSSKSATLEVLRDAAGSSRMPGGGVETGFGGMAGLPSSHGDLGLDAVVALAALLAAGWVVRRAGPRLRRVRPRSAAAAVVVVSAAVVAAGCGGVSSQGSASGANHTASTSVVAQGAPQDAPSATTPAAPSGSTGATSTRATRLDLSGVGTGPSSKPVPTGLTIGSIGVHTSLVKLGRNANGTAQVPSTTKVAGWYADGPSPGQAGPAVILGHVDSYKGPGVFFQLKDLKPGAKVEVAEGSKTVTFAVQRVATYSKAHFPTAAVYGSVPDRALRLVTCGGPFDYASGHYYDNVVVYATAVS